MRRRVILVGPNRWATRLAEGLNDRRPDALQCVPLGYDDIASAPWRAVRHVLTGRVIVRMGYPVDTPRTIRQLRRMGPTRRRLLAVELVSRLAGRTWARRASFNFWTHDAASAIAEKIRKGSLPASYLRDIRRSVNIAPAPHVSAQLRELGIAAHTVHLLDPVVAVPETAPPLPETMTVLSYVPDGQAESHGLASLVAAARTLPDVHFVLAGGSGADVDALPANMRFLGWVHDTTALYACCTVVADLTAGIDGPQTPEGLLWGRHMICAYETAHTERVPFGDSDAFVSALDRLHEQHVTGGIALDYAGREWAHSRLDADSAFETLAEMLLRRP